MTTIRQDMIRTFQSDRQVHKFTLIYWSNPSLSKCVWQTNNIQISIIGFSRYSLVGMDGKVKPNKISPISALLSLLTDTTKLKLRTRQVGKIIGVQWNLLITFLINNFWDSRFDQPNSRQELFPKLLEFFQVLLERQNILIHFTDVSWLPSVKSGVPIVFLMKQ